MRLVVNNKTFPVRLVKNKTAQALVELLPLSLSMEEMNGKEKYVYLCEYLPSVPSCPHKIEMGDVMLFGSNCLVVFYQSCTTRYSYTRIGRVEQANQFRQELDNADVRITIE